jgi:hypothetical protein
MEQEITMSAAEINSIAREIRHQLVAGTPLNVYWSWGPKNFAADYIDRKAALRFRVSGLLHKGYVYIALDEGSDTYDIYLQKIREKQPRLAVEGAYCDNMGEIIDGLVECNTSMNKYWELVKKEYRHKKI